MNIGNASNFRRPIAESEERRNDAIDRCCEEEFSMLYEELVEAIAGAVEQGLHYCALRIEMLSSYDPQIKGPACRLFIKELDLSANGFNVQHAKFVDRGSLGHIFELTIDWSWESKFHFDARDQEPDSSGHYSDWTFEGDLHITELTRILETTNWKLTAVEGGYACSYEPEVVEVPNVD